MDMLLAEPSGIDKYLSMAPMMGAMPPGPTGTMAGAAAVNTAGGNVEQMAQDYFLQHGYSPQDWNKVDYIIERESGWDPKAVNDSSGAAGIAQKISGYSGAYQPDNVMAQIRWLFNYLATHQYNGYGVGIDAAYAHKKATGWY